MKKIIMILSLVAIGLVACKKEDIKPNMGPYIENIDENIDEDIEEDIEEDNVHISDSMIYVNITVKTLKVSVGLNVNNDNKDYTVYSVSEDSSVYVSNGWNTAPMGGSRSWSGWIKPESLVTISGSFSGGNSNVFNFEIIVQIDNGTPVTSNHSITASNKNYSTIFYVK